METKLIAPSECANVRTLFIFTSGLSTAVQVTSIPIITVDAK